MALGSSKTKQDGNVDERVLDVPANSHFYHLYSEYFCLSSFIPVRRHQLEIYIKDHITSLGPWYKERSGKAFLVIAVRSGNPLKDTAYIATEWATSYKPFVNVKSYA